MFRVAYWVGCLALAALAGMGQAVACGGSNVLFDDNFATLDPSWGPASEMHYAKDGNLVVVPNPNSYHTLQNQTGLYQNADVCVRIQFAKTEDPTNTYGAIVFWALDYANYYVADIASNGYFRVARWQNERWLYPVQWTQTKVIKQGLGQWNELHLVLKDRQATFSINGTQVVTFKGQPPKGGSLVGLAGASPASSKAELRFADFKITE